MKKEITIQSETVKKWSCKNCKELLLKAYPFAIGFIADGRTVNVLDVICGKCKQRELIVP